MTDQAIVHGCPEDPFVPKRVISQSMGSIVSDQAILHGCPEEPQRSVRSKASDIAVHGIHRVRNECHSKMPRSSPNPLEKMLSTACN